MSQRNVVLGVTGSIAAYKAADLASRLTQAGVSVHTVMTESATKLVTPATFRALTGRAVATEMFDLSSPFSIEHVSLAEIADVLVIAPATANVLAKMACGIADDLVSSLALAACGECPILVAPAMNTRMWNAPPTQANMKLLRSWGVQVIGPGKGFLACRATGPGRLAEPAEIIEAATKILLKRNPKGRAAR